MKFKRIVLVVLVVVFAVGNVIAEKNKVSSKFYWMRIENKKRNIKITNKGDWIIRKDFENYPIFTIANISDKDKVSIDFKVEMTSKDKKEKYIIKEYKNAIIQKRYKGFKVPIPQKIINKLKPKEYRLKVVMVEDGKEKVIGERGDITIEGDHIEKIYKSYSDIEFKDGVEYFEVKHRVKIENQPMTFWHMPKIRINKIISKSEIINNGEKCIIYEKKEDKNYKLNIKVDLKKNISRTMPNSDKGVDISLSKFYGDILVGLSSKRNLSDLDKVLKEVKNLKLKPGESELIKANVNLKKLNKDFYRIIIITHKKNGKKDIKGRLAYYSLENSLFIAKEKILKSYSVKLHYKLKSSK